MSFEPIVSNNMSKVVDALRRTHAWAVTVVGKAWLLESVRLAKQGALAQEAKQIARLDFELRWQVAEGALSPDKWFAIAQNVQNGLVYQANETMDGALSISRFWGEVVVPTAVEIRDKASAATTYGAVMLPIALVAVSLLALVYLKAGR